VIQTIAPVSDNHVKEESRKRSVMARYGNVELTDMVFIYAHCERNERQAAALYAARFPERRHPHYSIFRQLEERMRRYGSLHAPNLRINVRRRNDETINAVRMAVLDNPHTSTRAIARELQMNHTTVHRIIKKNLRMQPYKRQTTQLLRREDFLRREAFYNWISEQVSKVHRNYVRMKGKNLANVV